MCCLARHPEENVFSPHFYVIYNMVSIKYHLTYTISLNACGG